MTSDYLTTFVQDRLYVVQISYYMHVGPGTQYSVSHRFKGTPQSEISISGDLHALNVSMVSIKSVLMILYQ